MRNMSTWPHSTVSNLLRHVQRPDMVDLQPLLQPVAEPMMAVSAMAENRRSRCFQQLKVLGEAMQGLSWLAYAGPNCGACQSRIQQQQ
jgi:hypothetical protein